jgi:YD repeat-containing protein
VERREKQWLSSGEAWGDLSSLVVWEYNEAGQVTLRQKTDDQGVAETTYVYDGQGQLVEQRRDWNGATWVTTKEYDGAGREVLHREEETAAGKTTTTWEQKRTTDDENGNILSQVREYGSSVSEQAWKTETATYVYNEAGLCAERFVELCYGDQGQQQENGHSTRILNEYDAAGRLLRKETDYRKAGDPAAEGSYLAVVSYTYDARGNLIREEETKLRPGAEAYKVIYVNTWEYDEDGILLRGGERTFPGGGERLEIREYDAAGNVTLAVTKDSDGVQRSEFTYAWFFLPEAATP